MAPEHIPSLRGRATITTVIVVVVLIALCLVVWMYRDNPLLSRLLGAETSNLVDTNQPQTTDEQNWTTYTSSTLGFSILFPKDYTSAAYAYQALGPGKEINGVKFTIAPSVSAKTNLSSDTYVSVEELPNAQNCSATLFLDSPQKVSTVTDNGVEYSVAQGGGAGAGNLYDETVYAIPGSMPCAAVRYFIHSTQIGNYPAGTRTEFDKAALVAQFDQIRRTLILGR